MKIIYLKINSPNGFLTIFSLILSHEMKLFGNKILLLLIFHGALGAVRSSFLIYFLIVILKPFKNLVFIAESVKPCPNDNLLPFHIRNISFFSSRNMVTVNSKLVVQERIHAPIGVDISSERCDLSDTSRCDPLPPMSIPDLCQHLNNPFFGSSLVSTISPKFGCPINEGEYSMNNLIMDMRNLLKFIPFPMGRLQPVIKFYQTQSNGKRRAIACFKGRVKLMSGSRGRKS